MKITRQGSANWQGTGNNGKGTVSTQSKVLDNAHLSFKTRFENEVGTNPEELVGAAHAGCYSMKLSFVLADLGYTATSIDTIATVTLADGAITAVHLDVRAQILNMTDHQFQEAALNAKENCPISKLLNAEITLKAVLV